jgi:hypothetical protein
MSLKGYSALCLGALFVFSTGPQTLFAQDVNRREAVCEAALRYFFTDEVPAGAKAICISSAIPFPASFINRFAGSNPPVVWSIECTSNLWAGIKRTNKNEAAFLIKIASIRWISGEEAEVKGGAAWGDFVQPPNIIHIVERNGHWIVKHETTGERHREVF